MYIWIWIAIFTWKLSSIKDRQKKILEKLENQDAMLVHLLAQQHIILKQTKEDQTNETVCTTN